MDVSYRTTLELDKIIARAVQLCTCAETKEMMRAIEPFATTEEERYALAQTNAINALLLKNGSPRFGAVHEVRRVVAHAAKGGILSMGELLEIAAALRNFSGLAQWYGLTDHDMLPTDDLFFALAPQPVLEKQIGECIISPEEMADTASVTLRDLRRKGQWRWLLLMAFAEPCCYFLLETRALCLTTASQAGMIISLLPLITAVVAWRLLGERVSLRGWIGFALAVAGVVWLSLQSAVDETATAPVLGNFFEGLAMVCAALYTVLARRLSAAYSPLQITAVQSFVGMSFFAGLLALAPLDYTPVLLHVEVPDWAPWASVVYLGGVVSLGGYGLYNVGVSRLSAAGAAAYTNLIPILTLASGVILLREVFLPGQYMASVLVVAGVLLSQWGGQKGRREDS